MKVGIIGVGVVGGALRQWFHDCTNHEIACWDPAKGLKDDLKGCDAMFISVPVPPNQGGQDISILRDAVTLAKDYLSPSNQKYVFIRSTVLPGTADLLDCIAMPEFLTERTAYEDMCKMPMLFGECDRNLLEALFPKKYKVVMRNKEAELAKFTHNCFGALKVTYFNMINEFAEQLEIRYGAVMKGAFLTGFIEKNHTQVPGPDGMFGFGGKCFPENVEAFMNYCKAYDMDDGRALMTVVHALNAFYRIKPIKPQRQPEVSV